MKKIVNVQGVQKVGWVAEAARRADEARKLRKRLLETSGAYAILPDDKTEVKKKKQNLVSAMASRTRSETYSKELESILMQAEEENIKLLEEVARLRKALRVCQADPELLSVVSEDVVRGSGELSTPDVESLLASAPEFPKEITETLEFLRGDNMFLCPSDPFADMTPER
uniref:BZIP domain-containing protein n=1 Tax=Erythrolobus madagascarensis TaxID=708628 RepID=A0A7S0XK97_9RHOD|mmetsp:Transcript_4720/g.10084  ORF Transcript_4720/g.10084 Transcript_4720/m.10084 type:complete len:170 (+) Transcript_4720:16-525(+)